MKDRVYSANEFQDIAEERDRLRKERDVIDVARDRLRAENAELRQEVKDLNHLLVCYRVGKQPNGEVLDRLAKKETPCVTNT